LNYSVYWQSENKGIFSETNPDETPISIMEMDCYLFKSWKPENGTHKVRFKLKSKAKRP
jgi:uncharacterized protein YcfL